MVGSFLGGCHEIASRCKHSLDFLGRLRVGRVVVNDILCMVRDGRHAIE